MELFTSSVRSCKIKLDKPNIKPHRTQNTMYSLLTARIILNIRDLGSRTAGNELNELHTGYDEHSDASVEFERFPRRSGELWEPWNW